MKKTSDIERRVSQLFTVISLASTYASDKVTLNNALQSYF